ncbi:MAG: hypothetical protein D6758_01500 [Gammaproteobacteria bacterium]|nr:MAG: hypothetical protein D6758_01500 [Gammaproteobacteria bacterium]
MSTPNEPTDNKKPQDAETTSSSDASETSVPAPDQAGDASTPAPPPDVTPEDEAKGSDGAPVNPDAAEAEEKAGQAAAEKPVDTQVAAAAGVAQAMMPPLTIKPVRTGALWAAIVLLLILVVVLSAGGWMLWQAQQQTAERVSELAVLKGTLAEERTRILDEASTRLQETLRLTEERQKAAEARLQQQISQLATKVLQQSATSRTDWLLAEAEYLLRLANQRLGLERDVKGALKVLEAADTVLAEADDPALVPVRQAIAEERAALRATGLPDRTGLFLRLDALAGQVERLNQTVFIAPVETHTSVGDQAEAEGASDWTGRLARLQQQVEKYLVIRRLDKPVEPLLSPDQIAYLKANLRLMLEQAQLAVMQQDEAVYAASLAKAERWLRQWLVGQDAATTALLDTLAELQRETIAPELPDITRSLRLLKGVIRQMEGEEGGS